MGRKGGIFDFLLPTFDSGRTSESKAKIELKTSLMKSGFRRTSEEQKVTCAFIESSRKRKPFMRQKTTQSPK